MPTDEQTPNKDTMIRWTIHFLSTVTILLIFPLAGCTMGTSHLIIQPPTHAPVSSPIDYPHITTREGLNFEQISVDEGLSSNLTRSIVQDFYGFIWIATGDGLNKYDGTEITIFRHQNDNPASLASNDINVLFVDADGDLWIGTNGSGLDRYERQSGQFVHYTNDLTNPASISSDLILSIYQDSHGNLWIGTVGGLNLFNPRLNHFDRYSNSPSDPSSLISNSVFAIMEDNTGYVWIGTGNGLDRMDTETGTFSHFRHNPNDPTTITSNAVLAIYNDHGGNLWFGIEGGGLNRYDPSTGKFIHYLTTPLDPSDPDTGSGVSVRAISQVDDTLWIGTLDNGLYALSQDGELLRHYRSDTQDRESLSDYRIQAIYPDLSGILWIATAGGGVNQLDANRNRFLEYSAQSGVDAAISAGGVLAILADSSGDIWIGFDGSGLDQVDPLTGTVIHHNHDPSNPSSLTSDLVRYLYQDHLGILWVGTDRGLNRYEPSLNAFTIYQYDPRNINSLADNRVTAIIEDRNKNLWVGTQAGLDRFNRTTQTFEHYRSGAGEPGDLLSNHILSLYVDDSNTLWVGSGSGLDRYDRATDRFIHELTDLDDPQKITNTHILSILQHSSGDLWLGTMGGLNRYDPTAGLVMGWTQSDGLPNEYIYCLVEDGEGYLWLSTNGGLARMDPLTGALMAFSQDDGLLSNSFNHNACATGIDGLLYFGSQNGVNYFQPSSIRQNPYIPPVVLKSVTQGGLPIDPTTAVDAIDRIILRWPNNYFEFEYSALSYSQPGENRFSYMLENYDTDWNDGTAARAGRYADLPAGNYNLAIKAANNDGIWNDVGVSTQVVVLPPFWQNAWFQWGLALLALVVVGVGVQLRLYSINQRNQILAAQVAERTREIEQRRQAAEGLKDILILINSNRPLAESLEFILHQTCTLMHADGAYLFEFRQDQADILSANPDPARAGVSVEFPRELLVWLRSQLGEPRARLLDPLPPALAQMAGAAVLQPLQAEGDNQAALLVLFNQKKRVTDEEINLLNAFAEHTSLAIGNDRLRNQAQELAVLSERNRLARDLHDAVSQTLFSASLITESLPSIWEQDPAEGQAILRDLHRLNRGALAEMRTLLMELRPTTIKEARLDDLIRQLVDAASGRSSLAIHLSIDNPYHLPVNVQEAIYRIAQEALNNIIKHASATQASISLMANRASYANVNTKGEVQVILDIEDNGCGFENVNIPQDHFGIQNMRERVDAVGAELTLNSQPGCGTRIRMVWQGECN